MLVGVKKGAYSLLPKDKFYRALEIVIKLADLNIANKPKDNKNNFCYYEFRKASVSLLKVN